MVFLKPDRFDEPFMLGIDDAGKPIEKPLAEMAAAEVERALAWHHQLSLRLERRARPALKIAKAVVEAGIAPKATPAEKRAVVAALRASGNARLREARLLQLVRACVPERLDGRGLGEALRRYWPYNR